MPSTLRISNIDLASPAPTPLLAPPPLPDQRYRIDGRLGAGTFGEVVLAFDTRLRRQVAIKILKGDMDPASQAALQREASSVAQLNHPNIITIHDIIETPHLAMVMEYVEGRSLQSVLKEHQRLGARFVVHIASQCLQALIRAHARGIVHRDIKPANVMLSQDETVKLVDFGLAATLEESLEQSTLHLAGSPAFMSPEAQSYIKSPACDLWSVAVMVFYCITGTLPFPRPNLLLLGTQVAPPLTLQGDDAQSHHHLVDFVATALQLDLAKRYPTAETMLNALLS